MKKKSNKASLGNIARLAGVSTSAVSLALSNKPGVSTATRARIHRIAQKAGYAPDARLRGLMAGVRGASSQEPLPIAWLNTAWQEDAWRSFRFHTPYLEGARGRAMELGYRLEEIWYHERGMTMRRLARILDQRGIEGVIVTHPARHIRLNWDHLASVALGSSLLAPKLHRIVADNSFNLLLALKSLRRLGYRRIGICLSHEIDSASNHTLRATALDLYFSSSSPERIPPLFHAPFKYQEKPEYDDKKKEAEMRRWLKRHKPEVIVGYDGRLKQWAEEEGFRVPGDVGIVHLAVDDDVLDWAGIHSHRREMGVAAVNWLVSLMRNHEFGVPKMPYTISIQGSWQTGRTIDLSSKR